MIAQLLFWTLAFTIFYSYLMYAILLWLYCKTIKKNKWANDNFDPNNLPEVTIVVAAHNEEAFINAKILNTQNLIYPAEKIKQIWVDDASTDNTLAILKTFPGITLITNLNRIGKALSINKAMTQVSSPITIFTDANTMLTPYSVIDLVKHFTNPNVGCVAGKKRILWQNSDILASKGEGIYWQYESFTKRMESCSGTTLSGTGELYAIRTHIFTPLTPNTILDDFEIAANIILKEYQVIFEDKAIASETGSLTTEDEIKRKVRIATGCFQVLARYPMLLNPFRNFDVAFKFYSHKITRWLIVPPSLLFLMPLLNIIIIFQSKPPRIFYVSLLLFITLYLFTTLGYLLRNKKCIPYFVTLPYYVMMMNISMIKGFLKYVSGQQGAIWEKANRKADI